MSLGLCKEVLEGDDMSDSQWQRYIGSLLAISAISLQITSVLMFFVCSGLVETSTVYPDNVLETVGEYDLVQDVNADADLTMIESTASLTLHAAGTDGACAQVTEGYTMSSNTQDVGITEKPMESSHGIGDPLADAIEFASVVDKCLSKSMTSESVCDSDNLAI